MAPEQANDAEPLIEPVAPHDGYSFEELQSHYNFRKTSDRRRVFVRLIRNELNSRPRPVRVLDIGCGTGISNDPLSGPQFLQVIRRATDELFGVEPDRSVEPDHQLFDHFQHATMESAELPENHFDVAFSFLVMEHVEDPAAFMKHVYRCLKPGGVYLFLTPNGRHYFTRIAKAMHLLKVDEWVLRRIARSQVENYHYPVRYRFNSERQIRESCEAAGFATPQFAYLEDIGPKPYFPGPTVVLFHLLALKRQWVHSKRALLDLICRVQKPA